MNTRIENIDAARDKLEAKLHTLTKMDRMFGHGRKIRRKLKEFRKSRTRLLEYGSSRKHTGNPVGVMIGVPRTGAK